MGFKGGASSGPPPATPEALYGDLPHRPESVPGLLTHQGDILRKYAAAHADTHDLALELPTGTGKTIPGLLIADWVRQTRQRPTIYACPTRQLAQQVHQVAVSESIPTVVLVGSHRTDWNPGDQVRYEAADAIAITTYSSVFNSSPKLAGADLLLFDDAHAGEQYVGERYAVHVARREDRATYMALLGTLRAALDGMVLQRLMDDTPDPGAHHQVRLVVPLRAEGMVAALDAVLAGLDVPQKFTYSMIRNGLSSCLVYVSYSGILVRPTIPPTWENDLFIGARQRLYLSATLGNGGELERAFGRQEIARLTLPDKSPTPRSGRRFFVFPNLVEDTDPVALTRDIVALAGKALVLTPQSDIATTRAATLVQPGWPVMGVQDVEKGMGPFTALSNGVCGLANRYDGLDLPGDACRVVVLEGAPDQDNLQERFFSMRVRAHSALAERIRTRVVQGAGRCTRGPNDWAVVVVLGTELTKYMIRPETWQAMDLELQAEIQFGIRNSKDTDHAEVVNNTRTFLEQGDAWRTGAEPHLLNYRQGATRVLPTGTAALAAAVAPEIEAAIYAWSGRWAEAGQRAQDAAQKIANGGRTVHGYQAFWLYLAATWTDQAGAEAGDSRLRRNARSLVIKAEGMAKPGTWLRDLPPLPGAERALLGPEDATAVSAVTHRLNRTFTRSSFDDAMASISNGLENAKAELYETALADLGTLLGADACKPPGRGRCDSAWCWGNYLWLALEAKSEQKPTGLVSHRYIRQANDQLRLLATDRGIDQAPPDSATVIVSPRPGVDPDGAKGAEDHVHLVHPEVLAELASDTKAAWEVIIAQSPGQGGDALRDLIATTFRERGVLPTNVRERLASQPVSAR